MTGHFVERKAGWDTHGLPVEIAVEQQLGLHLEGRHRALRHRRVQRPVPQGRARAPRGLEGADGADRLLGRPRRRVLHVRRGLRRVRLVGAQDDVGPRPALRGPQGRALLRALRHRALLPRGRAGLQGRRGPVRLRPLPGRRGRGRAARGRHAARLDDDARGRSSRTPPSPSTRSSPTCAPPPARCSPRRWSSASLGEDAEVADRFTGAEMLGARYEPPFPFLPGSEWGPKGHTVLPGDFVSAEGRHGHRPHRDRLRRGRLPPRRRAGPRGGQPGPARRHLRRAHRPVRRPLGQGRRRRPDRGPALARPAAPRGAPAARLPALLALRDAAPLLRQAVVVHPHVGDARAPARGERDRRPGTRRTSSTAASASGWRTTSTGRSRASATGARRCPSGAARTATRSASARSPRSRSARAASCPTRTARTSTSTPGRARSAARRCAASPSSSTSGSTPARCRSPSATRRSRTRRCFEGTFPADYICEAIDQTRGWFYSLIAISTLLFDKAPYRTVLCLGHIADPQGKKMSKSLGNIVVPWDVIHQHGADAFRWYYLTSKQPWDGYLFSTETVGESVRQFLLQLWNTYGFYVLYANVNDVQETAGPATELDRWALSRLQRTIAEVRERMEDYDATRAGQAIAAFSDELSNWYVRRSRRRFWDGDPAAFGTLQDLPGRADEAARAVLPVRRRRDLREPNDGSEPSVHLCDFPEADPALRDLELEAAMAIARETVRLGPRRARPRQAQGPPAAARRRGRGRGRGARGDRADARRRARRAQRQGAALRVGGGRARLLRGQAQLPRARPALRQADAAGRGGDRGARARARGGRAARRAAAWRSRSTATTTSSGPTTCRWPCSRSRATSSSARARTPSRSSSSSTTSCGARGSRARSCTRCRTRARRRGSTWRTGSRSSSAATTSCSAPRGRTRRYVTGETLATSIAYDGSADGAEATIEGRLLTVGVARA